MHDLSSDSLYLHGGNKKQLKVLAIIFVPVDSGFLTFKHFHHFRILGVVDLMSVWCGRCVCVCVGGGGSVCVCVYLCGSSIAECGESKVRGVRGHHHLHHLTGHVQFRESFSQTLSSHDQFRHNIGTHKVKVQRFLSVLCAELAVSEHTTLLQPTHTQTHNYTYIPLSRL